MAGVRRWMFAQPPPGVLKSVKNMKPDHSYRSPDLTTEPERDIDPTSTEGIVRRLQEPSVDRAEEKEYERCAFPTLCNGVNSDAFIQLDMSTSTKRSSHAATRPSTKRICMKADSSFYRANLQICEAASADEPVDRPEHQSPVDERQRTAEDVYATYVLQPERIMRMRGNSRAGSIGDQYGRWLNGVPFERMRSQCMLNGNRQQLIGKMEKKRPNSIECYLVQTF